MSGTGEVTTPFLGLIKPPIGADTDVWGDRVNTNSDTLDTSAKSHDDRIAALESAILTLQNTVAGLTTEAVGTVKWWPGPLSTVPAKYTNCTGQLLTRAGWPDLWNAIGQTWGGTGTNFNLPDLRGLVPVGLDQGSGRLQGQYGTDAIGHTGGQATVALALAHMPQHQHHGSTDVQGLHSHTTTAALLVDGGAWIQGASGTQAGNNTIGSSVDGNHQHSITTDVQGGGAPFTNVQPGALGYWIMRTLK